MDSAGMKIWITCWEADDRKPSSIHKHQPSIAEATSKTPATPKLGAKNQPDCPRGYIKKTETKTEMGAEIQSQAQTLECNPDNPMPFGGHEVRSATKTVE